MTSNSQQVGRSVPIESEEEQSSNSQHSSSASPQQSQPSSPSPEAGDGIIVCPKPFILCGTYFSVLHQKGQSVTAKCVTCSKPVKGQLTSTGNFLNHLKDDHKDQVEKYQAERKEDDKKRRHDRKRANPAQPLISHLFPKKEKTTMTRNERMQVNFVVKGIHPYSTVDEDNYKDLIIGISSGQVKPICRRVLGHRIKGLYEEMEEAMKETYTKIKYLAITVDAWTMKGKSRSYLGSTIHWIDSVTLQRRSHLLGCRRFMGSHTYDKIAILLDTIISDFKIPISKIVKATCDNGANFLKAFRIFAAEEGDDDEGGAEGDRINDVLDDSNDDIDDEMVFLRIAEVLAAPPPDTTVEHITLPPCHRCSSHTLNLICCSKSFLKRTSPLQQSSFSKCQAVWNSIKRSTTKCEDVKKITVTALKTPVATRWNSLYDAVSCLLSHESVLGDVFCTAGVVPLTAAELKFLKEYKECTRPIAQALDRLQGENGTDGNDTRTSGTYYGELLPTLFSINNKLRDINRRTPNLCDKLPKILLEDFIKRFAKFLSLSEDHLDAVVASISHPFHKNRWIPATKAQAMVSVFKSVVTLHAESMSNLNQPTEPTPQSTSASANAEEDFFGYQPFSEPVGPQLEELVEKEISAYLKSPETHLDMLHKYPYIKAVFIKYNTPLPSSAPVERIFNFGGMILDPKRRRLTDTNFQRSLMLKINL